MTGEDLTTQAGLAVQQDLALINLIGLTNVERNGHHYVNGMMDLPEAEQSAFLAAHPDLYERSNGAVRLKIRDGRLAIGSLGGVGFAAGAMPDYVQVGNEITSGMLWPLGQLSGNDPSSWPPFAQLMKAAIQGIQDAAGAWMPKIVIHIDRGGDWAGTQWFFDNLNAQGVPFDIIGESYYPFYQGSPTNLSNCLNNAAARYGKPIFIAEDAFPWTNTCPSSWTNSLYGFPPTTAGQVSFIAALARIVKSVPNQLGAGFFYWGAEYQAVPGINEAGYNTASFFDSSGNVLPVADAVGGMGAPLLLSASLDGSTLHLQWPLSGAASKLVMATNLAPSAVWSFVAGSIQTTGTVFTVTLPISNNAGFYRLQPD